MKLINAKVKTDLYTFQPELEMVISVPLEPFSGTETPNEATYEMLGRLFVTNITNAAKVKLAEVNNA